MRRSYRQPAPRSPQEAVDRWNNEHGIGTLVQFWPVRNRLEYQICRTTSAAWLLSGHTAVVMITGVRGCVALDACKLAPNAEECAVIS